MKSRLIVITGNAGAGKSTLAQQLGSKYAALVVSKDAIKERIFDELGSKDKTWSRKVSAVAHRIMDDLIKQQLSMGASIIVESNFKKEIDSARFQAILKEHDAECIQILCHADGKVLFERWKQRIANGTRHAGHVEEVGLDQIRRDLLLPYEPLDLPGKLIKIDTTNFDELSLPDLDAA